MTNNIRRIDSPTRFDPDLVNSETVFVVIDVYMFSSVVITLFDHGVEQVIPTYTEAELKPFQDQGMTIGGEERDESISADFNNLPSSVFETFGDMDPSDIPKTVAVASLNGAKRCVECAEAIQNIEGHAELVIGSTLNAQAVAEYIKARYPTYDVVLLCAGTRGKSTIDDIIGSMIISQELRDEEIYEAEYKAMLELLPPGRIENPDAFDWLSEKDIDHIKQINSTNTIPIYDFDEELLQKYDLYYLIN